MNRLLPDARLTMVSSLEELSAVTDVDVLVTRQMDWLAAAVKHCAGLRWLHLLTAGAERVKETGLCGTGCWISKSSGVNATAVAEFVLAAALYFVKRFHRFVGQQNCRRWERCWLDELTGKKAVLVGLGSIGEAIAGRLTSAGVEVTGVCRHVRKRAHVVAVVGTGDLGRVAKGTDFLVIAVPLTPDTRGLINRAVLLGMREGGFLIDVSRGGVVVQDDVVELLANGRLGGAALDVFEEEPLPANSPLWSSPNILITPHVAGTSNRFMDNALAIFEKNLVALQHTGQLATPVDMDAGY